MNFSFQNAALDTSALSMIAGGLLAFLSPCVLPMLPVYALYLLGGNSDELSGREARKAVLLRCLGLAAGFVLFFTVMGAGAGALGSLLKNLNRGTLDIITGALMLVFGLMMFGLIPGISFGSLGADPTKVKIQGFFGSMLFGMLLVLAWTPCLTPLLGNALILAASQEGATALTGMGQLALFGVGLCIPMLAFMVLYQWLKGALGWLRAHQLLIRRIGGGLMIAYGAYLILRTLL